jgi:high-affinity Fe2+/Pb2+ permease
MDETQKIQHRTFGWPVIIALIVLALVVGYFVFAGGVRL